ncbi:hypothetical protein HK104_009253 [Borealophlyctis nickersoniae]|nr:hypothetical protein HK104_009253 [Borealophlyctis nickersoniae]
MGAGGVEVGDGDEDGKGAGALKEDDEVERMERMYVMLRWSKKYRKMQVSSANASWDTPSTLRDAASVDDDDQDDNTAGSIDITEELSISPSARYSRGGGGGGGNNNDGLNISNALSYSLGSDSLLHPSSASASVSPSDATSILSDSSGTSFPPASGLLRKATRGGRKERGVAHPAALRVTFDDKAVVTIDLKPVEDGEDGDGEEVGGEDPDVTGGGGGGGDRGAEFAMAAEGNGVGGKRYSVDDHRSNAEGRKGDGMVDRLVGKSKVPAKVVRKCLRALQKYTGAKVVKVRPCTPPGIDAVAKST